MWHKYDVECPVCPDWACLLLFSPFFFFFFFCSSSFIPLLRFFLCFFCSSSDLRSIVVVSYIGDEHGVAQLRSGVPCLPRLDILMILLPFLLLLSSFSSSVLLLLLLLLFFFSSFSSLLLFLGIGHDELFFTRVPMSASRTS